MGNATILSAVIVTRVSTGPQTKGTSPETQLERCRAKAVELSTPIYAEYFDAGVSGGFFLLREGLQQALDDIRAGRAHVLIVPNIDRYSREEEHQHRIKREVREAGGRLVFAEMDFDDSPEGDLHFSVAGSFAAYERKRFRKRSMDGRQKLASKGIMPCRTHAPYGYHVPSKEDVMAGRFPLEQLGKYIIVPDEAAIVKRIFECYAFGSHSLYKLCRELNNEGIPTPRGAATWRPPTLRGILNNPAHMGKPAYGKMTHRLDETKTLEINPLTGRPYVSPVRRSRNNPSEWLTLSAPAIISEEVWTKALQRALSNRATKGGNPSRVRMLSGLLVCPSCGGGMRVVNTRGHKYDCFQCHAHLESRLATGDIVCSKKSYRQDMLEAAVVASVSDAVTNPEAVRAQLDVFNQPNDRQEAETRQEIRAIEQVLDEIANDEAAAVQAQIAGIRAGASPDTYAAVFADLSGRRKDLENRRGDLARSLKRSKPARHLVNVEACQLALEETYAAITSEHVTGFEKRDLLARIVEKVICRPDGATVVYSPGLFGEDTVHGTSRPQPMNARVRPLPSSAPRWARVSIPRAPPETIVRPWPASSREKRSAIERP